jgi:hypothetical protein
MSALVTIGWCSCLIRLCNRFIVETGQPPSVTAVDEHTIRRVRIREIKFIISKNPIIGGFFQAFYASSTAPMLDLELRAILESIGPHRQNKKWHEKSCHLIFIQQLKLHTTAILTGARIDFNLVTVFAKQWH